MIGDADGGSCRLCRSSILLERWTIWEPRTIEGLAKDCLVTVSDKCWSRVCGSRLVTAAILTNLGTAKKQLTDAYVVQLLCHGMLRRERRAHQAAAQRAHFKANRQL